MLLSPTFPDPLSSLNNLIFPETVDHLAIAKTVHRTNHLQLSDIKKYTCMTLGWWKFGSSSLGSVGLHFKLQMGSRSVPPWASGYSSYALIVKKT